MVRAIGFAAHLPRVPNLRRNIAFCRGPAPQLIAVISTARLSDLLRRSYLLPGAAISGIIALSVVYLAEPYLYYYILSILSRGFHEIYEKFLCSLTAHLLPPSGIRRRSIYNRYGLARRFSFSAFYLPHFSRDFRRFSRIFPEKSVHFRSVTILQVAFPVMLW